MIRYFVHRKLLLLLVCITGLYSFSTAQNFTSKIYTTSDGLPDAFVNSIYQDSKGYLWLGTRISLCRFNGYQFVDYGKNLGLNNLIGSVVLEDRHHQYWIHTKDGLALLKNNKLHFYPTSDGFKVNWLFSITEFSDGKIWMLTDKGIYQLEDTVWKKQNLVKEYKDLPCRFAVESQGGIYISYGWQLYFARSDGIVQPITSKQKMYPYYIWLKKYNGQVYVNTVEGIYKIVGDQLVRIFEKQINNIYSFDFLVDSKKRMWISTEKYGLLVSDPGNENELTHKIVLPFNQTLLFIEDREGNVWASNYEGLLKVKDSYIDVFNKQYNPLIENIRHMGIKPNGEILIKSTTNGFISATGQNFVADNDFKIAERTLHNALVDVSVNDDEGNTWMVTRQGDLYKVNKSSVENLRKNFSGEYFTYLAYDSSAKTVYACGNKIYSIHNSTVLEFAPNNGIVSPRRIYYSDQNVIVYSRDSGVYRIDSYGHTQRLTELRDVNYSYDDFQLFNDPDGSFWTTSIKDGLRKWNWDSNNQPVNQVSLSVNDGLPNTFVVTAKFDKRHRMWVATLSGLVVIEQNKAGRYIINRIDEEPSFHINNWGEAQLQTDKNGTVWLSSFHEIIRFRTDKVYFDKTVPNVAINEVLLNLKKTDWSARTDSLNGQTPIFARLPYNQNTITVSFDAITYTHNNECLFSYKLDGLDSSWQTATAVRSISFANLSPGSYSFYVKVRKPNTDWSEPARFSFIIRPPFWNTWWFEFLLILVGTTIITLFFRIRIHRIKNKALLQQQIQELDLKALKSANALMVARQKMADAEMQALRAQMNPHFIYNALNSIQSLVIDNRKQEAIRYIGKFAKLLRQILEQTDNHLITLEKELNTLELYIQLETLRMNAPLEYHIDVDEQLMPEKELIPPLIIQPYVENALWHGLSRKTTDRKLWIEISTTEDWLFVKIRDNGIGRQQAAINKKESGIEVASKGMSITASRLALMNEESQDVPVAIIDLFDDDHQPCGTEVTLRIVRISKV